MTLAWALAAASIGWALLLPLAPLAASQPASAEAWHLFAFLVYAAGSVVCHQLPDRSFYLGSAQMAVCARCTGIYVGAALAAVFASLPMSTYALAGFGRAMGARALLAIASSPTALTLLYEWTTGDTPSNVIRAFAGAPLGAAAAFIVVRAAGSVGPAKAGRYVPR